MRNLLDQMMTSLHTTAQTGGPAIRAAVDSAVVAGALSWPWWVQIFDELGARATLIGGLILLALRIRLAWKEGRRK